MASGNIFWRDPALGEAQEISTSGGAMRVHVAGRGEPIVFVHGALVNANLWRKVVAQLAPDFRCITLDMPLGAHELTMPEADLSPTGLGDLIADAVGALGLEAPTIVANDTGGALTQVALSRHPEAAGRLVLTSCDAYENFPPRFFKYTLAATRYPGVAGALFAPLRLQALRGTPLAFGWLMHSELDPRAGDSYLRPYLTRRPQREDFARFWHGCDPRYTQEAIAALREQERPTLVAWSRDDRFFPPSDGERLARDIPGARLEWIENARTFSMEDQPGRLAELVAGFVREPAGAVS